jgi:hypothetical protein
MLNTNKQSMLTLIKCDDTSNKIILYYSYKITFLPLLHSMKQVKSGNIKENMNIQKGIWNLKLWDINMLSASSSLILHLLLLSLSKKLINTFINVDCYTNISSTDLIFGGSLINTPRELCAGIYSGRDSHPREKINWSQCNLEVKIIKYTRNNLQRSLRIIHPKIFHVIFVLSVDNWIFGK